MEREWEDRKDSSVTMNEALEVVADVYLLPTKCLWRTFKQPGGGILDAGTAPDRDAAKLAAEDALPKPKGLRWEQRNDSCVDYTDGDQRLATIQQWGSLFEVRLSKGVPDQAIAKSAAEAAVAVLRGTPAAPAAEAGDEQYHEWAKIEATSNSIKAAVKADREQRDETLIRALSSRHWLCTTSDCVRDLLAKLDAEAK